MQDYLLALTTDDHLLRCAAQVLSLPMELAGSLPVAGCPYHSGQEKEPLCLWHEYRIYPAFTWSSVPVQSLPSGVREQSSPIYQCHSY